MPSPFPGMDPYLEGNRWEAFHASLAIRIADVLQPILAPRYLVRLQERAELVLEARSIVPDVSVSLGRHYDEGGVAVLAPSAPVVVRAAEAPYRETYLHIVDREGRRVVTVVELLSPSNKRSGAGSRLYLRKQAEVLEGDAHLVEIDLLRTGGHTAAVPRGLLAPHEPYDYLVSVNRSSDRARFECYPFSLRRPLPMVAVPLLEGDTDAVLDLRAALDRAYNGGYYELDIDYRTEPDPPLRSADAAWADALLREKGLRD